MGRNNWLRIMFLLQTVVLVKSDLSIRVMWLVTLTTVVMATLVTHRVSLQVTRQVTVPPSVTLLALVPPNILARAHWVPCPTQDICTYVRPPTGALTRPGYLPLHHVLLQAITKYLMWTWQTWRTCW